MYVNIGNGELPQKGPDGSPNGISNFFGPSGGVIGYDDPSIWFNSIPPYINRKGYYEMLVADGGTWTTLPRADMKSIFICPMQASSGSRIETPLNDYFLLNGKDSTGTIKNNTGMANQSQFPWAGTYVFNSKLTDTIDPSTNEPAHFKMSAIRAASETVMMTEKITNSGEYVDPIVQGYINGTSGRASWAMQKQHITGKLMPRATTATWVRPRPTGVDSRPVIMVAAICSSPTATSPGLAGLMPNFSQVRCPTMRIVRMPTSRAS